MYPSQNSYILIYFGRKTFLPNHDNYHRYFYKHLKLHEITLFHIGSSAYQMLPPLGKLLVIIMGMMQELQMCAMGTIFIVETWNVQKLFLIP